MRFKPGLLRLALMAPFAIVGSALEGWWLLLHVPAWLLLADAVRCFYRDGVITPDSQRSEVEGDR